MKISRGHFIDIACNPYRLEVLNNGDCWHVVLVVEGWVSHLDWNFLGHPLKRAGYIVFILSERFDEKVVSMTDGIRKQFVKLLGQGYAEGTRRIFACVGEDKYFLYDSLVFFTGFVFSDFVTYQTTVTKFRVLYQVGSCVCLFGGYMTRAVDCLLQTVRRFRTATASLPFQRAIYIYPWTSHVPCYGFVAPAWKVATAKQLKYSYQCQHPEVGLWTRLSSKPCAKYDRLPSLRMPKDN